MPEIVFDLATPDDDAQLRRLLRRHPMPGPISITLEREPNYFLGAEVHGPFQQTIVARDRSTGEIVGMAARSVRDLYLNASPQAVGYLSDLRIQPDYRAMRRALAGAFAFLGRLAQDGRAALHFGSITENNLPARRLITGGLPGLPRFHEFARLHTLAIHCRRQRRSLPSPDAIQLARGSAGHVDGIAACLQRNGARYQLAPCWSRSSLFSRVHTPALKPEDFFLALDGETVVGCLALWDQTSYKQTVVRGYSGRIRRWRRLVNLGARLVGAPRLPPPNTPIRHCYASHLAVDDDNPEVFGCLLRSVYNRAVEHGNEYVMLGLCEEHPLLEGVMSSYRHLDYKSRLYLLAWEGEREVLSQIDGRLAGVDVSIL